MSMILLSEGFKVGLGSVGNGLKLVSVFLEFSKYPKISRCKGLSLL